MQVCKEHYYTKQYCLFHFTLEIGGCALRCCVLHLDLNPSPHCMMDIQKLEIGGSFGSESISTLHDVHSKVFSRLV